MDGFHDSKWFVYINDHHEGPFSMASLQSKLQSGEVNRTQYVWREGMSDWQLITTVRELEPILSPSYSPPAPAATPPAFEPTLTAPEVPQELPISSPEPSFESTLNEAERSTLHDDTPPSFAEESSSETLEASSKASRKSGAYLKIFLLLALLGATVYVSVSGAFSTTGFIADFTRPGLARLARWIPPLQNWISPLPTLHGVSDDELKELSTSARQSDPPVLALGVSQANTPSPTIYVTSGLPDGAKLELVLIGAPETLLSQTNMIVKTSAELKNRLATFSDIRQADGHPIAQGEYHLHVVDAESASQPSDVATKMNTLPNVELSPELRAEIQGNRKLFASRTIFLGGEKNETYMKRLKDFHDRLRSRSDDELKEISTNLETLTAQLNGTIDEYKKAFSKKINKVSEKRWNDFHQKWTGTQTQLDASFSSWVEPISRKEFYHWALYQLVRATSEKISQLHIQQHSGLAIRPSDEKDFQAQLKDKENLAQAALVDLQNKLKESLKINEGIGGMPRRLPLDETSVPAAPAASTAPANEQSSEDGNL